MKKNGSAALHTSFAESLGWLSTKVKENSPLETLINGPQ
jgi:hypothetical protein